MMLALLLAGCASSTIIRGTEGSKIMVNDMAIENGSEYKFRDTSFGQHIFKIEANDGSEATYGLLPLDYLAADILFFAPALFFNLRSVYAEYDLNLRGGFIRFRKKSSETWRFYKPTKIESDKAKHYYKDIEQKEILAARK